MTVPKRIDSGSTYTHMHTRTRTYAHTHTQQQCSWRRHTPHDYHVLEPNLDGCLYAELQGGKCDEVILLATHCQTEEHNDSHHTLREGDEKGCIQLCVGGGGEME